MPFSQPEVEQLLAACHRRCCICHRFCGVKMETDHIVPQAEQGSDAIENAIPVCFDCHAEIHSYNDQHPRGRKFRSNELRQHKAEWLRICRQHPEVFASARRDSSVGPLQALIDELEFNLKVAERSDDEPACLFSVEQFSRAIHEGAISIIVPSLRETILEAYVAMGRANAEIPGIMVHERTGNAWAEAVNRALRDIRSAKPKISAAHAELLRFLASETSVAGA